MAVKKKAPAKRSKTKTTTKTQADNKGSKKATKKTPQLSKRKLIALCSSIDSTRQCDCKPKSISCFPPKDWVVSQLGVWRFSYSKDDIREKKIHPATYPLALPKKFISLMSHENALILDPFVGSGTTLKAAKELNRNCVGFDLQQEYVDLSATRLKQADLFSSGTQHIAICDDARNISDYFEEQSIDLIVTSPPYANLLNRKRQNKSRRVRQNDQLDKVEQYSQDPRDLGTLEINAFTKELGDIFSGLLPLVRPKCHCVINVPDYWMDNKRYTLHISVVNVMREIGFELRNTIIWDKTNLVNAIGIFGYPSNYITMGTTFEYLLDFWRPE